MTTAFVAIGGNLGDALATVLRAMDDLATLSGTRVIARSSLYRSAPVDATGPDFINAVVAIDTALAPHELLAGLQRLEQAAGRERPYRNAPRTLDLDLLLYDDAVIDTPTLSVPHPRMHQRAFVLAPLLEVDPDIEIPHRGRAADYLPGVADQGVTRLG